MRFAHLSDLHLCPDPRANPAVDDHALEMAARTCADLLRLRGSLDFVVVSGDLTDDAAPESFQRFERLFAPLDLPLFVVPGNHDGPTAFQRHKAVSDLLGASDISGRLVDLGALRVLGIDTCVEAQVTGAICPDSLGLLARALDDRQGPPLLIVMHHPPFAPGLREFDAISVLANRERFDALLAAAPRRPTILCGHVHRPYAACWRGTNCFIAGSPARRFAADPPFGDAPIHPSAEPFSYFIHDLDAAGMHVMTSRWIPCGDLPAGAG